MPVLLCTSLAAQTIPGTPRETALRFLQQNTEKLGLTPADIADVRVTDEYRSKHNGVTHVWVQQQHAGIPVYNALIGLIVLPNNEVRYVSHRFVSNL